MSLLHNAAQVPWGMVTGPDGNLYIAMDDEFWVLLLSGHFLLRLIAVLTQSQFTCPQPV